MKRPPKRPSERSRPDDDKPLPRGQLRDLVKDPALQAEIARADIVVGMHPVTGERSGPFYGIAAMKRIMRRDKAENLYVTTLPVDPATDDIEAACALVQAVKGAHCYGAVSEPPRD
jgi:hypothetical protein